MWERAGRAEKKEGQNFVDEQKKAGRDRPKCKHLLHPRAPFTGHSFYSRPLSPNRRLARSLLWGFSLWSTGCNSRHGQSVDSGRNEVAAAPRPTTARDSRIKQQRSSSRRRKTRIHDENRKRQSLTQHKVRRMCSVRSTIHKKYLDLRVSFLFQYRH